MTRAQDFLDFFDAPAAASFNLPPLQALGFFRDKGLRTSFDWRDVFGEEHAASFTVAKMMDTDMLADVYASLEDALARGVPYREWADGITPLLQARGWWGRQAVVDPVSGQVVVAQLGSPSRLQLIFRQNLQSAYAVGAWDQIQDQAELAPYLLYDAVDDHRTRPEHAALDNQVHPVASPFWRTYYPPNGWNCRCSVIQLDEGELEALGLKPSPGHRPKTYEWRNPRTGKLERIADGTDPGFSHNLGVRRLEDLAKLAAEKARALPPAPGAAAVKGIDAAQDAARKAMEREVLDADKAVARLQDADAAKQAAMRAAERAAQRELDEAVAKGTPYLAKAIRDLRATKAGAKLGPTELLEQAKARAAKAKSDAALADWRKAYLANKPPSAAAQAAFDALPDEAQAALRERLDAIRAEEARKALRFNDATPAGAWHAKAWDGAPAWMRARLVKEQDVTLTAEKGGAYAQAGMRVNMPPDYNPADAHHRDVWRHEFGHIVDQRMGREFPADGAMGYISAGRAFTSAMEADAKDLIGRTFVRDARQAEKRAEFLKGYDALQGKLVDMAGPAERQAYLRERAQALGLDLPALRALLQENSAALFDTLAGDVRMARILEAIERGDAERFVAEAIGMDTMGTLKGAPWQEQQQHALMLRASWRKGSLSSFADLLGAATRNKVANHQAGFFGHTDAYYRQRRGTGQQTEAFANLTALAGAPSPLWWDLVRRFLPEMARTYEELLSRGI